VSEAQLLSMYYLGEAAGEKKGYAKAVEQTTIKRLQAVVYIDPARQGAYDQPSPATDPALQRRLEEEKFKRLLDVTTKELHAIRAHPGGITRSGVTRHYVQTHVTGKLKPITLENTPRDVAPDEKWIV
jgi:hypothetical protein